MKLHPQNIVKAAILYSFSKHSNKIPPATSWYFLSLPLNCILPGRIPLSACLYMWGLNCLMEYVLLIKTNTSLKDFKSSRVLFFNRWKIVLSIFLYVPFYTLCQSLFCQHFISAALFVYLKSFFICHYYRRHCGHFGAEWWHTRFTSYQNYISKVLFSLTHWWNTHFRYTGYDFTCQESRMRRCTFPINPRAAALPRIHKYGNNIFINVSAAAIWYPVHHFLLFFSPGFVSTSLKPTANTKSGGDVWEWNFVICSWWKFSCSWYFD